MFKSKVSKLNSLKPKLGVPAPGKYDVDQDLIVKKSFTTYNVLKRTSSFAEPISCQRVKVNVYDPFVQTEKDPEQALPGPGAYSYNNIYETSEHAKPKRESEL